VPVIGKPGGAAQPCPAHPLFASLDGGAHMMKGCQGEVPWDDTIRLGIELRKKLHDLCHEMHVFYSDRQVGRLRRLQFRRRHFPALAMKRRCARW